MSAISQVAEHRDGTDLHLPWRHEFPWDTFNVAGESAFL